MSYYLQSITSRCSSQNRENEEASSESDQVSERMQAGVVAAIYLLAIAFITINGLGVSGKLDGSLVSGLTVGMVAAGTVLAVGLANQAKCWRWRTLLISLAIVGGYAALNFCGGLGSPATEWINMAPLLTAAAAAIAFSAKQIYLVHQSGQLNFNFNYKG